jgi:hypothetical protein
VISGTNKRGQVSGVEALARADDVTVYAERSRGGEYHLRYDKRRWQPCDAARARGAGVPRPPAPEPPAARSPSTERFQDLSTPANEPDWPDFSLSFIREAAAWGVRERESYLAQLRRRNVHRSTIEGWLDAVDDSRALEAGEASDAPEPDIDSDDDDNGGAGSNGAPILYH